MRRVRGDVMAVTCILGGAAMGAAGTALLMREDPGESASASSLCASPHRTGIEVMVGPARHGGGVSISTRSQHACARSTFVEVRPEIRLAREASREAVRARAQVERERALVARERASAERDQARLERERVERTARLLQATLHEMERQQRRR